ncbi:hypothetical protein BRARA_K01871 [Brassica rapa]|uniref:Nucleoside phosphorylase domain-containing protein n=1 Tax=Brassica campestris TaxID=3711 RepID=A0A397L1C5_BRACM|nr:hypothetical protein BRARA_K01871 [Brassica rapa]
MGHFLIGLLVFVLFIGNVIEEANGEISPTVLSKIEWMNKRGPYLGIVAPNNFELNPLLTSQAYVPYPSLLLVILLRFRFGKISNQRVVIVMSGLGMVNAGVATQLLGSLFRLKGVLHYGIAGNADVNLEIGDVTIPKYWAHSGLWNWQVGENIFIFITFSSISLRSSLLFVKVCFRGEMLIIHAYP